MATVTKPVILDETGVRIAEALEGLIVHRNLSKVVSLDQTELASGKIIEAVGTPVYVNDVTQFSDYGITDKGWYIFARVIAQTGTYVTAGMTITGDAGHIAQIGADHVDLAIRFEVAAMSCKVLIDWVDYVDTFVFKATDLAVRNLDYRTTFYVYDIEPFATWEYGLTTDAAYVAEGHYYRLVDGAYVEAIEGTDWTAGDAVPAYYTLDGETYTQATGVFEDGVTYYTKSEDTYTEATVTAGEAIPAIYKHTKVTFNGMARNVTYVCNTVIDCPTEFILPEIEDETHGCWFEIRFMHSGSFSSTLTPPEGVKIATEHTQAETKGINMVDLHYTSVAGIKAWRFMNTHSSMPTTT